MDGEVLCSTLEDMVRETGVKIERETAIPVGRYEVIINFSTRFQRPMPLLLNVPGFTGIRIHSGNTEKDTEGCILVGKQTEATWVISNSRATFSVIFKKIEDALKKGKLFLEVS